MHAWWMVAAWIILAGVRLDQTDNRGIVGSKHDFSDQMLSSGEICRPCHHPHTTQGPSALWEPTVAPSPTLPLYTSLDRGLTSTDLMCLSCHDGAIAPRVGVGAVADDTKASPMFSATQVDVHGGGHPIGTSYPVAQEKYHARSRVLAEETIKLPEGRISCVSCHAPHNSVGGQGMLVMSNRGSQLCLSCHDL